jgi:hypothetical protein
MSVFIILVTFSANIETWQSLEHCFKYIGCEIKCIYQQLDLVSKGQMERSNAIQDNNCKLTKTSHKTGNFRYIANLNGIQNNKWKGHMQSSTINAN